MWYSTRKDFQLPEAIVTFCHPLLVTSKAIFLLNWRRGQPADLHDSATPFPNTSRSHSGRVMPHSDPATSPLFHLRWTDPYTKMQVLVLSSYSCVFTPLFLTLPNVVKVICLCFLIYPPSFVIYYSFHKTNAQYKYTLLRHCRNSVMTFLTDRKGSSWISFQQNKMETVLPTFQPGCTGLHQGIVMKTSATWLKRL